MGRSGTHPRITYSTYSTRPCNFKQQHQICRARKWSSATNTHPPPPTAGDGGCWWKSWPGSRDARATDPSCDRRLVPVVDRGCDSVRMHALTHVKHIHGLERGFTTERGWWRGRPRFVPPKFYDCFERQDMDGVKGPPFIHDINIWRLILQPWVGSRGVTCPSMLEWIMVFGVFEPRCCSAFRRRGDTAFLMFRLFSKCRF